MVGTRCINVYTVLDNVPQKYIVSEETTVEDIILKCCQSLTIKPVARQLFSLRIRNENEFVSCGNRILKSNINDFEFRLRYKLPYFKKLEQIDSSAYNYYFHQVRLDVMENKIPDISYDKNKDELVGLGVTDMYRVMLETGVPRETVESDYKKYIPKEIRKHHSIFVKKPIHNSLSSIMKGRVRNSKFVVNVYLKKFEDMAPNYLVEQYIAKMDDNGALRSVVIKVDPYNRELCGIIFRSDGKSEWNHLCSIDELCYISVGDGTTEVSRKSGIPVYLRFDSINSMESFISLLDGYYRFTLKWTFNLCKDLPTPSLRKLSLLKCHGPVGGEFSYAKLEEKRNSKSGCFILRESETAYDSYYLDVCTNQSAKPTTYKIHQRNDDDFLFSGDNKSYPSIPQLLKDLRNPESQIVLQECLPPSEYDQSPLLLCKTDDTSFANSQSNLTTCAVTGPPQCIDTKTLQVYKGQKIESYRDMTLVYRGVWHCQKNKKVDVAIKVLKAKNRETNLPDLLELAGKWAFLESGAVVKLFGITLIAPVLMVTEYFPLGSLDTYLRENQNTIKEVDLVEAATCLANAVWHMEEAGVVHGNIRCYKLLVAAHTDNSFSVRLSDPGLPTSYKIHDIHWIPVEWHRWKNMDEARKSIVADMWAVGTTFWEIFSYGQTPPYESHEKLFMFYHRGNRLPKPKACSSDVYNIMLSCWDLDPHRRKKPQEALRDINQNLYEVFNSRRTHSYATVNNNSVSITSLQSSSSSSMKVDDISSFQALSKETSTNGNILPFWMSGSVINRRDSFGENSNLLYDYKGDSDSDDVDSADLSIFSHLEFSTATTSLDSMTSLQGIFQLDGEYNVILRGRIGQGFYGEVYNGTMEHLSGEVEPQVVAVKRIKSELLAIDPATLQDFEREIMIMKRLKHPNIVEIKGVIQEPEISLVMEYIHHGPLHCYLNIHREKLNPYENLLKFAYDIAQGMEYLGAKNIVHRDLAARNILVASETHVKISDFGLAQVMGSNDYYILKTNRELPLKWYAPESLENGKFSTRSDVWSYGVTLYEIFSFGEDPLLPILKNDSGLNQVKLLMALQNGERLPCTSTCPQEIYVQIMAACWFYDSHKRITFKEISERITSLQSNRCDL